jgi:hypothetical protein
LAFGPQYWIMCRFEVLWPCRKCWWDQKL